MLLLNSDEADTFLDKHDLGVVTDFQIVATETAHVLNDDRGYVPLKNLFDHCLKAFTVKGGPANSIIGEMTDRIEAVLFSVVL